MVIDIPGSVSGLVSVLLPASGLLLLPFLRGLLARLSFWFAFCLKGKLRRKPKLDYVGGQQLIIATFYPKLSKNHPNTVKHSTMRKDGVRKFAKVNRGTMFG